MKLKSKLSKLVSAFTVAVMCFTMLPNVSISSSAANVGDKLSVGNGTNQHKGNCDGYSYEVWIDTTGGSGSMTLGQGASFKAEWNASVSSGNFLARRGLDFGSQKKATDYPYIGMDYEADYRQTGSASGNSRLCVYGWFQNKNAGNVPLVEYYIIEDWVDWCPDANGKMVTIDGAQYKIFQMDHTGPTINGGSETFKQYFSVRQDKRTSGHITVSDHFKAWADQGWGIGNLYEVALNAEGWQSSGVADIKKLDVYTDPNNHNSGNGNENTTPTVDPDKDGNYFYDTFESGAGNWSGRGDASVALDSKNYVSGSKSLAVTGRTDNWHGAAIELDSKAFVGGNTYSFSTGVLQRSGSSVDMKMTLQYSLDGEDNYDEVASATAKSGEWTKLENTAYTIPSGASNLVLYVEAPDSLTDFYIDEAKGSKEGVKSSVTTGSGTVQSGNSGSGTTTTTVSTTNSSGNASDYMDKIRDTITNNVPSSITGSQNNDCKEEKITYYSTIAKKNKKAVVILPPNYSTSKKYPVVYVNHGIMGSENDMVSYCKSIGGNLMKNGEAEEMILVSCAMYTSATSDQCSGITAEECAKYDAFREDLIECLMPYMEEHYSIKTGRENTAICGFSMGGRESLYIGITRPQYFGYIGAASPAPGIMPATDMFMQHPGNMQPSEFKIQDHTYDPYLLMITGGTNDTVVGTFPKEYHTTLEANGQPHIWQEIQGGGHDASCINPLMYNFLRNAFKSSEPSGTTTTTTTTTNNLPELDVTVDGDVNCDNEVNLADAVLIMQNLANPSKYKITDQGRANGDVDQRGDGITSSDAFVIQKYVLGIINKLPESYSSTQPQNTTTTTTTTSAVIPTVKLDSKFSDGTDGWESRGAATLALDKESYYSAGSSLKVSGREDNWQGAAIPLTSDFKAGGTYSFSAGVMQASGSSQAVKMTLQYDLNGETNYDMVAEADAADKTWTKLENTAYTIPEGATDLLLYVELPDSLADYYLDDVVAANEGTKSSVVTGQGTVGKIETPVISGGKVDPTKPMVAISFDDGAVGSSANATSMRIINALAKQDFRATFFYVGDWIRNADGEQEVKYAYSKGMEIANHSTSHPDLTTKSASEIRSEYDKCAAKLKGIIGAEPSKLLRLPYLACNNTVQSTLNDVPLITCSIDTADWNNASKDQIVNKIKQAMNDGSLNGSIVLCHETYETTAAAIEELAPYLKEQGWQIVTISEMFAAKGKTLNGGQVYTKA